MTQDSKRWQRIRELIGAAMELSGEERARWLDRECAGDSDLRREAEELLAHDDRRGKISCDPSGAWVRTVAETLAADDARIDANSGRRVGAYLLLRAIGAGGMGTVYLAERDDAQFKKRVAVKLIKRGMDTDEILRRFKNERQILADLEHPNIARLLDGGATDDRLPYLVLEYVDGIPIDRWCDDRRASVRERIELFLSVCSAVQYAHRSLVVHRDIKPSNVLVTAQGVPKLLDFGIAKLLASRADDLGALDTLTSERRFTPAYASPEQLRGESITTATDVFSLGVVLYELLAGERPFATEHRSAESAALERPERPSTIVGTSARRSSIGAVRRADASALRRILAGDLDTIVLKAMHAEPLRRYASVDQLAADLRRHLDGMPVLARPDSLAYRSAKFVKRNKLLVAAASTIFLALAIGFTTSTVLYIKAVDAQNALTEKSQLAENRLHEAELAQAAEKVQRELAERRFADVRKLATKFIFDVHSSIEQLQGSLPAQNLIVNTATEYLERLASEKRDDADLQLELVQAWLRIGVIQSSLGTASLGQTTAALHSIQRASSVAQDLVRADPNNPSKCAVLIDAQIRLTEALLGAHRLLEARDTCEETVGYVGKLHAENPESLAYEHQLFRAHFRFAEVLETLGEYDESLLHHRAAVAIAEHLASDWPGYDEMQARLGVSLGQLGLSLDRCMQFDEALSMERRALEVFERIAARSPTNSSWRREIGVCRNLMARTYSDQGCIAEACTHARAALETMISLSRDDALDASSRADTASLLVQCARMQDAAGDHDDAIRHCRAALGFIGDLVYRNPDNLNVRESLAAADTCLATALVHVGRPADALVEFEAARDELEALAAVEPNDAAMQVDLHECYVNIGKSCALVAASSACSVSDRIDDLRAARDFLERGLAGLRALNPEARASRFGVARIEAVEEELRRCRAALARADTGELDDSAPPRERGAK